MTLQTADLRRINLKQNIKVGRDSWDKIKDRPAVTLRTVLIHIAVGLAAVVALSSLLMGGK